MNRETAITILTDHAGCKKDGDRFLVPESVGLTVFASAGHQTLTIEKVSELVFEKGDVLFAKTERGESFIFDSNDLRLLHIKPRKTQSTGYSS